MQGIIGTTKKSNFSCWIRICSHFSSVRLCPWTNHIITSWLGPETTKDLSKLLWILIYFDEKWVDLSPFISSRESCIFGNAFYIQRLVDFYFCFCPFSVEGDDPKVQARKLHNRRNWSGFGCSRTGMASGSSFQSSHQAGWCGAFSFALHFFYVPNEASWTLCRSQTLLFIQDSMHDGIP